MSVAVQRVVRELETGKWRPFYLVVGDESFQANLVAQTLKTYFLKDESSKEFNYESWDGEQLDAKALVRSLETIPGLFDDPDTIRLISCSRFEKLSPSGISEMEDYFKNPSPTTCFLIFCTKVDKRKGWYKRVSQRGLVVDVSEPYDRDWPRWHGYFEKKLGKKVDSDAWGILIESSGRKLSLLWAELQKLDTYVGKKNSISRDDVVASVAVTEGGDVFQFVDDVLCGRSLAAMREFDELLRGGESEIKILSLLVRQFRLVDQCKKLVEQGVVDSRAIGPKIGVHPFFVPKVVTQTKHHSFSSINWSIQKLADCDFRLKVGESGVFEGFLAPYFSLKRTEKGAEAH